MLRVYWTIGDGVRRMPIEREDAALELWRQLGVHGPYDYALYLERVEIVTFAGHGLRLLPHAEVISTLAAGRCLH